LENAATTHTPVSAMTTTTKKVPLEKKRAMQSREKKEGGKRCKIKKGA
jgi:hypothetical protein